MPRVPSQRRASSPCRVRRAVRPLAHLALAAIASALACPVARAQWSVDAGVERYDWREDTAPIVVHEHGPRFILGGGWMQPRKQGLLFAYRGELYAGSVTYEGSFLFAPTTPATGGTTYLGTTQAVQARWRWAGKADAVVGVEYETWRRRLSSTQEERFRIVSLRLGAEHVASDRHPIVGGGGVRFMLATHEEATIGYGGRTYALDLEPGPGSNPYLHAGYRVTPRVTFLGNWDGMRLGRSNTVTLGRPPGPTLQVWQPATDMWRLGIRVVYGW